MAAQHQITTFDPYTSSQLSSIEHTASPVGWLVASYEDRKHEKPYHIVRLTQLSRQRWQAGKLVLRQQWNSKRTQ